MTFIDKKALNNRRSTVRNGIRNDAKVNQKRQQDAARNALQRATAFSEEEKRERRVEQALLYNTANLAHKVLAAFGIDIPIRIHALPDNHPQRVRAYTDFTCLYIHIRLDVDLTDVNAVVEFIAIVKGALYHEGGHNKYTLPYPQLIGRVITLHNNEQAFDLAGDLQMRTIADYDKYRRAWNIIEDQAMEVAMCCESPILARYFTATTINVVIDPDRPALCWPYITGRTFLDPALRKTLRKIAKTHHRADLIPQIDSVVAKYRCTSDVNDKLLLVAQFKELLDEWGFQSQTHETDHSNQRSRGNNNEPQDMPEGMSEGMSEDMPEYDEDGDEQTTEQPSNESSDNGDTPNNTASDDSQDSQTSEADGNQSSDEETADGQQPVKGDSNRSDKPGMGADNSDPTGDIKDMLDKAQDEVRKSSRSEAESFVESVNDDIRADMLRDRTGTPMPPEGVADALRIKGSIIGGIEHLLDQTSPSWRFRQENGILDPTAYALREPGETDYWSGLDGMGNVGYDLSVSVMLDTSYSMAHQTEKLSIVALAIKQACEDLEIPCTVTTFNTTCALLYDHDKQAIPTKINADGGTQPLEALEHLDSQRLEKKRHLIFILTDGEWSEVTSLAPWSQAGRYFTIIGLDMWDDSVLRSKNPNSYFLIREVGELPQHFARALAGFLA